jgi:glycosyltransferase involved in cell wall biosynthesis
MIHTAVVAFSYYPQDTRIRRETEAILDLGIKVDVICLQDNGEPLEEDYEGIRVYRLNMRKSRPAMLLYFVEYIKFIIRASIRLSLLFLRNRYRIIHIHNQPDILVFAAWLPKLFGVKIILDMHEIMPELFMNKLKTNKNHPLTRILYCLEKISARFSDHIILATPFLKRDVAKRSATPGKCTAILNLPDPKIFYRTKTDYSLKGQYNIIYPGTLSELHGVELAIHAIHLIREQTDIPAVLHIYGDGVGSVKKNLIQLVEHLNIADYVYINNGISREELVQVLTKMDVGLVTKLDGVFVGEAISTKLFEFAIVGLPVICSRTPGDSLYFNDSMVTFFEPDDIIGLADSLVKLYKDLHGRQRMAENAKKVTRQLNWGVEKEKLYSVYKSII